LGYLAGRFSFKSSASGETLVPDEALRALAPEGIRFIVEGPATYEQLVPPVRDAAAHTVQWWSAGTGRIAGRYAAWIEAAIRRGLSGKPTHPGLLEHEGYAYRDACPGLPGKNLHEDQGSLTAMRALAPLLQRALWRARPL